MEPVREERPLPEHPLKPCRELDLRDGEGMTEMEGAVHIRIRECSHPFGILFMDLCWGEPSRLLLGRWVNFEETFRLPSRLILLLYCLKAITFPSLDKTKGLSKNGTW